MQVTLWPNRGDVKVVDPLLRIQDQRAKLLGLYEAVQVRVEHSEESANERRRRLLERAADRVAAMSPEEVAAEGACLAEPGA